MTQYTFLNCGPSGMQTKRNELTQLAFFGEWMKLRVVGTSKTMYYELLSY